MVGGRPAAGGLGWDGPDALGHCLRTGGVGAGVGDAASAVRAAPRHHPRCGAQDRPHQVLRRPEAPAGRGCAAAPAPHGCRPSPTGEPADAAAAAAAVSTTAPAATPASPPPRAWLTPSGGGGGWTRVPFLPFPPPTLPLARITPTFSSLAHPAPPRRPPLFVAPGFRPLTRAPAPFSAPAVVAASPLAAGAAAGVEGPPTKRRRVPADAPVPEAGVPAFRWHEAAGPEVGVAVRVPRSPPLPRWGLAIRILIDEMVHTSSQARIPPRPPSRTAAGETETVDSFSCCASRKFEIFPPSPSSTPSNSFGGSSGWALNQLPTGPE